jgi:hypothetical protein
LPTVYSPGTPLAPSAPPPADTETEVPKTEEQQPPKPSLADEIRADRERRQAQAKKEAEEASWTKERDEYKAKVSKFEKAKDNILLDSISYLRELGLTDQEAARVAENVMFTLVPDKAPPDFRQSALEAQYKRDQRLREEREAQAKEEAERRAQEAAAAEGERLESEFKEALASSVTSYTTDTHPASVAWFGQDHEDYVESLLHTARNIAEQASRAGQRADLSPANIAAVLEKRIADKASRFAPKAPAEAPPVSKPRPAPVKQIGIEDKQPESSTQRAGIPDERERLRRAAAVVFRDRE